MSDDECQTQQCLAKAVNTIFHRTNYYNTQSVCHLFSRLGFFSFAIYEYLFKIPNNILKKKKIIKNNNQDCHASSGKALKRRVGSKLTDCQIATETANDLTS